MCKPLFTKPPKTPPALSSYNFICLLNLPAAMEKFGPLRCIWEGGPRGKGFARFAKPFMKAGIHPKNWQYNLHLRLLRAKAFSHLLKPPERQVSGVTSKDALRDRKGDFHKYQSELEFTTTFSATTISKKQPISIILVENIGGGVKLYGVAGTTTVSWRSVSDLKPCRIPLKWVCSTQPSKQRKSPFHGPMFAVM
jgi:hypothetical protein